MFLNTSTILFNCFVEYSILYLETLGWLYSVIIKLMMQTMLGFIKHCTWFV